MVLGCVCNICNQLFGDELELFLASDTVEAVLRMHHGLGTKSDSQKLRNERLTVRVTQPGDLKGLRLRVRYDPSRGRIAEPLPQVALRQKGETEWRWFLEDELDAPLELEAYRTPSDVQFAYPSNDLAGRQRLTDKLKSLGVGNEFKLEVLELPSGPVETWVESAMDDVILRAVGKIAFNYLAFNHGAQFCLRDDFDAFRNFVRYGKPPNAGIVVFSRNSQEMKHERGNQCNGHTVLLGWNVDRSGIVCQITLFDHLTYSALLCSPYTGRVWFSLPKAHCFNINTRSIAPLC